ncbi:hypothetical protein MKW94_030226 [Papaver nudicaule]|uniref:Bidirectional sugar transporter SWEET n=1 Tax=Papaver nudicaule TaxID=74823 RepID=A0AA41VJK3_PAPNU|nr:hypothetical protein [Papaver nudicaule]
MEFRTVAGLLGIFTSCWYLLVALLPRFYKIHKGKKDANFSIDPYLASILSCALWVFYGMVHPHHRLLVMIDGFGLCIQSVYVAMYLRANEKQILFVRKKSVAGFVFYLLTLLLYTVITLIPISKPYGSFAIGVPCILVNTLVYATQCRTLLKVYKAKSLEYMPIFGWFLYFLNSGCWLTYALLRFDPFIVASTGLRCIMGIIQLSVSTYYYRRYPQSKYKKIDEMLPKYNKGD